MQELHDHIDDLLQDRDPKGQREEERSNPVLALPAVSEQTTASVNVIQEVADEEGQPAIQPNVAADTTSQGGDQTEVDEPADSDNTAPGPVAEGDVAAEQSQDMDTSRSAESKGDLNDSVVDDYIQVCSQSTAFNLLQATFFLSHCLFAHGKMPFAMFKDVEVTVLPS